MNKESSTIRELQLLEHNLQQVLMQKQALELELGEVNNASRELDKSSDEVYRIIGNIMMSAKKHDLKKELEERKKIIELRISSLEKQESLMSSKAMELQKTLADSKKDKS